MGAPSRSPGRRGNRPALGLLLAVPCALPLAGALRLMQQGQPWALLVYAAASLLAFALYWHDKRSASAGLWRIPENTLHGAALLGGWPGALLAQQLLRHKTRKLPFQVVFWAIVMLHLALWSDWWLGWRLAGQLAGLL